MNLTMVSIHAPNGLIEVPTPRCVDGSSRSSSVPQICLSMSGSYVYASSVAAIHPPPWP